MANEAKQFSERLNQALDNTNFPALHKGRLSELARRLEPNTGKLFSNETVRKWVSGEVIPRRPVLALIADILDVPQEWLLFGTEHRGEGHAQKANERPKRPANRDTIQLSISLRSDFELKIEGVPKDLTRREAEIVCRMISALAKDGQQG